MAKRRGRRALLYLTRDICGAFAWAKAPDRGDDGVFTGGDALELPKSVACLIPYETILTINIKEAIQCTCSRRTGKKRPVKPITRKYASAGLRKLAAV